MPLRPLLSFQAALLLTLTLPSHAQQNCAASGPASAGGPLGYQLRGDRCEGRFVQDVAGAVELKLASFSAGLAEAKEFPSSAPLKLAWVLPSPADLRLRAISLRSRHYYSMDTLRNPNQGASFNWPTGGLRTENLKPNEVGVVARTSPPGFTEEVYIPLRIGTGSNYKITLLTAAELNEIYFSFTSLSPNGKLTQLVKKEEPLGRGYYPASVGIPIPVPSSLPPGYYRLDATADRRNGGSIRKNWIFYHPGPQ